MKKLVWSATRVEGGQPFHGSLPGIPHATGTFQNYDLEGHRDTGSTNTTFPPLPQFGADAAVVAYRVPDADNTQEELHPVITASGGTVDAAALSDGDVQTPALLLRPVADASAWMLFDYGHPQAIQSITIGSTDDIVSFFGFDDQKAGFPFLEASDDGQNFRHVVDMPYSSVAQRTISFAPVTARYFRVAFPHRRPGPTCMRTRSRSWSCTTALVPTNGSAEPDLPRRPTITPSPIRPRHLPFLCTRLMSSTSPAR